MPILHSIVTGADGAIGRNHHNALTKIGRHWRRANTL
jgi:hypothetical protein